MTGNIAPAAVIPPSMPRRVSMPRPIRSKGFMVLPGGLSSDPRTGTGRYRFLWACIAIRGADTASRVGKLRGQGIHQPRRACHRLPLAEHVEVGPHDHGGQTMVGEPGPVLAVAIDRLRTDAGISDAFGSSTLKAFRPVHSSKLHHLFLRLSLMETARMSGEDPGSHGFEPPYLLGTQHAAGIDTVGDDHEAQADDFIPSSLPPLADDSAVRAELACRAQQRAVRVPMQQPVDQAGEGRGVAAGRCRPGRPGRVQPPRWYAGCRMIRPR